MHSNRNVIVARNLLVGAGAYYLSRWLIVPVWFGFGRMTKGLIYSGEFNGEIVMPLVEHFPLALVAFVAGAAVVWLVESDLREYWLIFPANLYGLFSFLGHHWVQPPLFLDRLGQVLAALLPAIACVIGGVVAGQRVRRNLNVTLGQ